MTEPNKSAPNQSGPNYTEPPGREFAGLPELARVGEASARPLPPGHVRHLGDRRRRRRYGAIVGVALAAVVVAGAGVVTTGLLRGGEQSVSPVAATPSAGKPSDASSKPPAPPSRRVTAKNLLTTDDVPVEDRDATTSVVAKPGVGRVSNELSVCWATAGRTDLGAVNAVQRNFALDVVDPQNAPAAGPLTNQPVIYTQALQFADVAAAKKAQGVYASWLARCAGELKVKGYDVVTDLGFANEKVSVPGASALVSEVVYQRPGGADGDNAFWESVGLTLVKDRLMVTVYLHYGEDFNSSLDQSEGDLQHPQLALVESSAERLAV